MKVRLSTIALLVLLLAAAFAVVAAKAVERPTITYWGEVKFDYTGRDCAENYTQYIEPCPGCKVWIDWSPMSAEVYGEDGPIRIEGTITDIPAPGRVPSMCQVLRPSLVQKCDE